MSRYRIMTPVTPRAPGRLFGDFEQTIETESLPCARHILACHDFTGCTVWKRRAAAWCAIFDTSGPQGDYADPAAAWARVEAAE